MSKLDTCCNIACTIGNNSCSLFQVDYEMRDNVFTKEKKPLNEREEDLKSLEEEYNHIREDWRITWGKQEGVLCCHLITQKYLF